MTGMDYVQMGIDAHNRAVARRQNQSQNQGTFRRTRSNNENRNTRPKTRTERFSGTFELATRQVNQFYKRMESNRNFRVISTNTVPTMSGVVLYVTYES